MAEHPIDGKWLILEQRRIYDLMRVLGIPPQPPEKLILEWIERDKVKHQWAQISTINNVPRSFQFTLGEEVEHDQSFDGTKAKSIFTINGNILTEVRVHHGEAMTVVRTFTGDKMSSRFTLEGCDVVATTEFKKIKF